jgi:NAD(P)-dependent dehydrogenase (short-subunit alcohol dehydrogenase family)
MTHVPVDHEEIDLIDHPSRIEGTCLITGGTSGLGQVTATRLAAMGAEVLIVSRNSEKCAATVEKITRETGNSNVTWLEADLSSQQEIRDLVTKVKVRSSPLSVLVNNAGVIVPTRTLSPDGIELTLATNYLGPFLLTNLLLDKLRANGPSRVVNVCSVSHAQADIDFDNFEFDRNYRSFKAYARSKLALLLFTYELARRTTGTGVTVNAANPGLVWTKLGQNGLRGRLGQRLVHLLYRKQSVSPEEGAKTIVYLCSSQEVEGITGKYFTNEAESASSPGSHDVQLAGRLWDASADLVNIPAKMV